MAHWMYLAIEAMDDTLVIGLDMCSEIGCKVLHTNVLEIVRDNMPREIVLEVESYDSFVEGHDPTDEEILDTGLKSSMLWNYCDSKSQAVHQFSCRMHRGMQLLRAVCIHCECISQSDLVTLDS
jgi:hypothetical protein